ncbi:MAG: hypothetical protein ABI675_30900 [Chitinophagaceae bacterium]
MIIIMILCLLFGFIPVYLFIIRPWHLRWGATQKEAEFILPGDSLLLKTDFNATRGITINSSPELIWRWIIQIGSKRAGWYSIDWMDNGRRKSSDAILPEFQNIEIDQFIPFTPNQKNGMWINDFKKYKYILWADKIGNATWLWYLSTDDNNKTRLLTRLRTKYLWKGLWIIYYLLYDMGDIIMMSKCMKGIKRRAEFEATQNK